MIEAHEGYTAMRERESARRLARYDEAVEIIENLIEWAKDSGCDCGQDDPPCALCHGLAFIDSEPKEGEGGR